MRALRRPRPLLLLLLAPGACSIQDPAPRPQEPEPIRVRERSRHPVPLRGNTLLTLGFPLADLGSDGEATLRTGGKIKPDVDPTGFELTGHFFLGEEDSWGLRFRDRDYDLSSTGGPFFSVRLFELLYRRWFFQRDDWSWDGDWAWFLEGSLGLGAGESSNPALSVDTHRLAGSLGLFAGAALLYDGFLAEARFGYSATGVENFFFSDELAARGFELALAVGLSF